MGRDVSNNKRRQKTDGGGGEEQGRLYVTHTHTRTHKVKTERKVTELLWLFLNSCQLRILRRGDESFNVKMPQESESESE